MNGLDDPIARALPSAFGPSQATSWSARAAQSERVRAVAVCFAGRCLRPLGYVEVKVGTSCTTRTCDLLLRRQALSSTELTRYVTGAERGLRSPDARAFNAPLYRLSYLGKKIPSGHGFRRRPIVAADFRLRSRELHAGSCSIRIPLRLCPHASASSGVGVSLHRGWLRPGSRGRGPPCTSRAAHTRLRTAECMGTAEVRRSTALVERGLAFRASCRTLSGQYRRMSCGKLLKSCGSEESRPSRRCAKVGPAKQKARFLSEAGPLGYRARRACA